MESIISYKRIINALRIALGYINKKGKTPKKEKTTQKKEISTAKKEEKNLIIINKEFKSHYQEIMNNSHTIYNF